MHKRLPAPRAQYRRLSHRQSPLWPKPRMKMERSWSHTVHWQSTSQIWSKSYLHNSSKMVRLLLQGSRPPTTFIRLSRSSLIKMAASLQAFSQTSKVPTRSSSKRHLRMKEEIKKWIRSLKMKILWEVSKLVSKKSKKITIMRLPEEIPVPIVAKSVAKTRRKI